ncbi:glycosyltransferase family 2 protein [Arthrobacter sp. LS16]|uniref:glycosyltransferase family 2 protein n=1 Tax=Arthrobacter sp. 'calajunan' TaxID=1690248 RepID=UPI003C7788FF
MSSYIIFAFESESSEVIRRACQIVHQSIPSDFIVTIGISEEHDYVSKNVKSFPKEYNRAQIFNALIAELPDNSTIYVCQGLVLPNFVQQGASRLDGLQEKSFVTVPPRLPIIPPNFDDELILNNLVDLDFSKKHANENPSLLVLKKSLFMRIRGFDERPAFKSVLFMDLMSRLLRAGACSQELQPCYFALDLNSLLNVMAEASDSVSIAEINRRIALVASDVSIYRNLTSWSAPKIARRPLVSVAIATRNRGEYLRDSLYSIQNQTFEDWEVVLVDDGSDDDTQAVVESFNDPRIKYIYQEPTGISRARNLAAENSRGFYTAVHDDDDIMLPWRLETSISSITANAQATYGSWVNFQNTSGDMVLHITKNDFSKDLIAYSGQAPGHATWLLPTAVIRTLRYDETLTSSVDHNLAVRSLMSGLTWKHTEKVLFIRRIHETQVSVTDSRRQRSAAILTKYASNFPLTAKAHHASVERGKALKFPKPVNSNNLFEIFGLYLPDHLVKRNLKISGLVGKKVLGLDIHDKFTHIIAEQDLITDKSTLEFGGASDLDWSDMVRVRESGFVGCDFTFEKRPEVTHDYDISPSIESSNVDISSRIAQVLNQVKKLSPSGVILSIRMEVDNPEEVCKIDGVILARHLTINYEPHLRDSRILLGFSNKKYAFNYLDKLDSEANDALVITSGSVDLDIVWKELLGENR